MEGNFSSDIEISDDEIHQIPIMKIKWTKRSKFHRSLAKFRLGKIINKHIIFEVLSYAGSKTVIIDLIGKSCKTYRSLLVINKILFYNTA